MRAWRGIVLISFTALIAACGSSDPGAKKPVEPKAAHAEARLSPLSDPDGTKGPAPARSNEVAAAEGSDVTAQRTETSKPPAEAPCKLVTRSQASTIVGEQIAKPREAPQGPTCIYSYGGDKQMVTLAVQSRDTKTLRRELGKAASVKIGSESGFCGGPGQQTLYVPLSTSQVLSVAAPCDVAKEFAARALAKLD